jgi:hypothetical protein
MTMTDRDLMDRCHQDVLTIASVGMGIPPLLWPYACSMAEVTDWWQTLKQAAMKRAVVAAIQRPHERPRALCPWCGDGPTLAGFTVPLGLEHHWEGHTAGGAVRECPVGRAARYLLAAVTGRAEAGGIHKRAASGEVSKPLT